MKSLKDEWSCLPAPEPGNGVKVIAHQDPRYYDSLMKGQ